jgi:Uma2 family endonuclease
MTAKLNSNLAVLDEENDLGWEEGVKYDNLHYYYDDEANFAKLKQRDMPTKEHNTLKTYLLEVLQWSYKDAGHEIYDEFNFYTTQDSEEEPLYPDIAVVKNYTHVEGITSHHVNVTCPAPSVIIEVISSRTRPRDVSPRKKPQFYADWGTKEYFAYDPRPRKRKLKMRRLWGWQLRDGVAYPMELDKQGRLWSIELDSWLVPSGKNLKLYDNDGNLRLTEAEAQKKARLEAEHREQQERAAKEAERAAKEAAYQKLRELGFDPKDL